MGDSWTDWKSEKSSFGSVIFSYSVQQQWTIYQLDCDVWQKVDFLWQLVVTSSVGRPRSSSKALPKATVTPKKVMVTVWRSAACLIHYSFLNTGETITSEKYAQQIDELHWKLQCLQPALVNRKGPILLHDKARQHAAEPILQKLNELGYEILPRPSDSCDLSPTAYHFIKHLSRQTFAGKTLPQTAGGRKCFPRVLKAWIFTLQE